MKPESARYLDKARSMLNEARIQININLSGAAGRSAYFAGYHSAQALIFEHTGKVVKTHSGLQSQFALLARDLSTVDEELRAFLGQAYNLKAVADYESGPNSIIPADRAKAVIALAERFIVCIEDILV